MGTVLPGGRPRRVDKRRAFPNESRPSRASRGVSAALGDPVSPAVDGVLARAADGGGSAPFARPGDRRSSGGAAGRRARHGPRRGRFGRPAIQAIGGGGTPARGNPPPNPPPPPASAAQRRHPPPIP